MPISSAEQPGEPDWRSHAQGFPRRRAGLAVSLYRISGHRCGYEALRLGSIPFPRTVGLRLENSGALLRGVCPPADCRSARCSRTRRCERRRLSSTGADLSARAFVSRRKPRRRYCRRSVRRAHAAQQIVMGPECLVLGAGGLRAAVRAQNDRLYSRLPLPQRHQHCIEDEPQSWPRNATSPDGVERFRSWYVAGGTLAAYRLAGVLFPIIVRPCF